MLMHVLCLPVKPLLNVPAIPHALVAEHLFDSIDDFFGLVHNFLDQLFQLFAGGWIDIHLGFFGFDQKLRILQRLEISVAENLYALGRCARSYQHRPAEIPAG